MNITQTLTFALTALVASCFTYADDFESLLTRSGAQSQQTSAQDRPRVTPQSVGGTEIAQVSKSDAPPAGSAKAQEVLVSAADKLKSYASVRANITAKVTMASHSFAAKGSYLQGQNLQLRWELTAELGGRKGSLLEVCDGQVLWSRHDLGEKDETQITRRDVRQILQAAEQAAQQLKSPDEKSALNLSLVADLGIGGLPALLAAFTKDYDFKPVTQGKIDDRDMIVIEGTWNSKYLDMWRDPKAKDKSTAQLPFFVPDFVRMSFDQETEFPRRIEYFKKIPGQGTPSPMFTVDFTKVVFNGKVSRDDFVFIPPERPAAVDLTQMYLQRLLPPKKDTKAPAEKAAKPAKKE